MWNLRRAREALLDTFGDVRMDGTMASISGTDAPHLLITKSLYEYIEETKEYSLLMEETAYFEDGIYQTKKEQRKGTLLEHVLLLQLVAFYKAPYCGAQIECFKAIVDWLDALLKKKGIRYIEIFEELVPLLEHREDLLESKEYRTLVLEQYEGASVKPLRWVKTRLPAEQIMDSLASKAEWIAKHLR